MEKIKIVEIAFLSIPLLLFWWLFRTINKIHIYLKLIYELLKEQKEK